MSTLRDGIRLNGRGLSVLILTVSLYLINSSIADAEFKQYSTVTTTKGVVFKDVKITGFEGEKVRITHRDGVGRIPIAELPSSIFKDIESDYNRHLVKFEADKSQAEITGRYEEIARIEREQRRRQEDQALLERKAKEREELRKFEELQQALGLIKYDNQWITPEKRDQLIALKAAERRELEFKNQAIKIVMRKAKVKLPYKVIQSLDDGSICKAAEYDQIRNAWYYTESSEFFFLIGASRLNVADNEEYTDNIYWSGTYSYTAVGGNEKTINSYTLDKDKAIASIRKSHGLSDAPTEPNDQDNNSKVSGFGTGFFITKNGYLITNNHVVQNANKITVKFDSGALVASVVAKDPDNDIALLKINAASIPVTFAADKLGRLGQTVFTIGFPMPQLQGFEPKVTKGVISSLTGIQDDVRMYQIDAAVQPGNSGGPLADENGNVIGVVSSRISDAVVAKATGTIAQNINYACKKSYLLALIENVPDAAENIVTSADSKGGSFEDAVKKVGQSTAIIIIE